MISDITESELSDILAMEREREIEKAGRYVVICACDVRRAQGELDAAVDDLEALERSAR